MYRNTCHIANLSVYYCLAELTLVYACCGDTFLGPWLKGNVLFNKPNVSLTARPRLYYVISAQEWYAVDFCLFRIQADGNIRVSFWSLGRGEHGILASFHFHLLNDDRP